MSHALKAVVIEIDMGEFDFILIQRIEINAEPMILGGDFDPAGGQVLYRLIDTPMAEFQFIGFTAESEAHYLMSQANPEKRFFA